MLISVKRHVTSIQNVHSSSSPSIWTRGLICAIFIGRHSKERLFTMLCLFSGDERTECGIIGGSIHESYSYCFFETNNECDSFTDLECDYTGDIIEELTNVLTPEECELMCKHNNCNYWVFESQDGQSYSCKFFNSKVGKVCFFSKMFHTTVLLGEDMSRDCRSEFSSY